MMIFAVGNNFSAIRHRIVTCFRFFRIESEFGGYKSVFIAQL